MHKIYWFLAVHLPRPLDKPFHFLWHRCVDRETFAEKLRKEWRK